MNWRIKNKKIKFEEKEVDGKTLTVESVIPMNINATWEKVIKSSTLEFVAKGMMRFKPLGTGFPKYWEVGKEVKTRTLMWGIIPMGGIHHLSFVKIDRSNFTIQTEERDATAKVWNHTISLKELENDQTLYTDSIEIYAGWMTGMVTWWAKHFYIHRQKRWLLLPEKLREFK